MSKYRGKYKKCRECRHSKVYLMVMVQVEDSCQNSMIREIDGIRYVINQICESCNLFEKYRYEDERPKDFSEYLNEINMRKIYEKEN